MPDSQPDDRPAPASAPAGWVAGPPDYVGVGTARSGTTWWDRLINAHPRVSRQRGTPKEVHFFDRFWEGELSGADIEHYYRPLRAARRPPLG